MRVVVLDDTSSSNSMDLDFEGAGSPVKQSSVVQQVRRGLEWSGVQWSGVRYDVCNVHL